MAEKKKAEDVVLSEEEKAVAEEKAKAELADKIAKENEEYVPVELFRDNHKYKNDLEVGVNGEVIRIKRGEKVMVKRKFKKVIDLHELQDKEAALRAEAMMGMKKLADM